VAVWDVAASRVLTTLEGHDQEVKCLAISADGKTLASGSSDWTVKVWDLTTGNELRTIKGNPSSAPVDPSLPFILALTPDGKGLVIMRWSWLEVWDVAAGRLTMALMAGPDEMNFQCLAISADRKTLATGYQDGRVKLWDVATEKTPVLPDRSGADGWLRERMERLKKGGNRALLKGHTGGVLSLAFTTDGQTLATGAEDRTLRLWDVVTGQERAPSGSMPARSRPWLSRRMARLWLPGARTGR
jgi:WD40 repeat protein